jgi:hypothetical protein
VPTTRVAILEAVKVKSKYYALVVKACLQTEIYVCVTVWCVEDVNN